MSEVQAQEMTAAEELKSILDTAVEAKADKAELEGFVKSEDLEGFVKADAVEAVETKAAEALEAMKAELQEEIKSTFAQAPAIQVEKAEDNMNNPYNFPEYIKGQDAQWVTKAVNTTNPGSNDSIAGSPIGANGTYADLVEGNPFRSISNIIQVTGSSFNVPHLGSVATNRNEAAGSFTEASAVTDSLVKVDHYNTVVRIAEPVIDDVPGLEALLGPEMAAQTAAKEHEQLVAVLDAATFTNREEQTDISDGVSLADISNLMGLLAPQYWNQATWAFNPTFWSKIQVAATNGTGSPVVIDPVMGGFRLYGRPVIISGELDDGTTADDKPGYFGDFRRGVLIGERQGLEMKRSDSESIGHMTYWATLRSGIAVREGNALVRLDSVA